MQTPPSNPPCNGILEFSVIGTAVPTSPWRVEGAHIEVAELPGRNRPVYNNCPEKFAPFIR